MRTRIALAAATAATLISSTLIVNVDAMGATRFPSAKLRLPHADAADSILTLTAVEQIAETATPDTRVVSEDPSAFIATLMQRVATPPPPPPPPVTDATSTTTPTWACIRYYESTDRYNTPSAPDGAYQITESTWEGMGYTGLPYEYSASMQNAAALRLYNARGWEPWSTRFDCGL